MKRIAALLIIALFFCGVLATGGFADDRPDAKLFCLTFDDGPDGLYTDQLLDGLALRPQAKVTFFFLGEFAEKYPDDVLYAWRMGHQVGSHTYNHASLGDMQSEQEILAEIDQTEAVICALTGQPAHLWVRPPYGSLNSVAVGCIARPLILWDSDPGDWKGYGAGTITQNLCGDAHDGIISGLHCTHAATVEGALDAIDRLTDEGYQFVTAQELLWLRGITPEDGKKYYNAKPDSDAPLANWGWFDEDAGRCFFDRNGWRHYGWLHTGGKTYYLDPQTAFLRTGWQYIDGVWYNLGDDGVLRATVAGLSFADVSPDSPAWRSIRRCCRNGLMAPTADNTFSPQDAVSAEDMRAALWKLAGQPEGDADRWAQEHGLLSDNGAVTGQQALDALSKVAELSGRDSSSLLPTLRQDLGGADAGVTRAETAEMLIQLRDYLSGGL